MELPGSSYLYALATISITFAGFAAMIVILRQVVSGSLVNYDLYFIRSVLMRSFIVVACAMLPPMLALFKLSDLIIWRSSGLIAGLIQGVFILTLEKKKKRSYRRATRQLGLCACHLSDANSDIFDIDSRYIF